MTQTGPDLVGAGYPISRPLMALMGGLQSVNSPNVSPKTNIDWGLGQIVDGTATSFASPGGQVLSAAVPVTPGDVITKITYLVGGTPAASANVTNYWAALYTGTGSAPGTTNAQPTLIAQTASLSATNAASKTAVTFSFSTPQTITSINAPYGFVYCSVSMTTGSSPTPSYVSMTCSSAAGVAYQWFTNGPVALSVSHNATQGSAAPTTMSNTTAIQHVPIVFLY